MPRMCRVAASQEPTHARQAARPSTQSPVVKPSPCRRNGLPYNLARLSTGFARITAARATRINAINPPPRPYQIPAYRNGRRAKPSEAPTLQGIEPWLEVPPLIDPFLEDRAAHLLRTRGSDAPLGLVELQALRFELETTEIQHSAHIGLEILDHVFVLDAQYPPRQYRVPVRHQLDVGSVIPADVLEAVGELLTRGKQLLEVAEAAGHGVAARIDDPGGGQDQADQAEMPEIIRHLVDEEGLVRPVDTRLAEVFAAQRAKILRRHLPENPWVARILVVHVAPLQFQHHARNIGELHRALDLRM